MPLKSACPLARTFSIGLFREGLVAFTISSSCRLHFPSVPICRRCRSSAYLTTTAVPYGAPEFLRSNLLTTARAPAASTTTSESKRWKML